MTVALAHRVTGFLLLFVLAVLWGSGYAFIKISVETITPLTLVAARVSLSALVLIAFNAATGARMPRTAGPWLHFMMVGISANVVAYIFLTWGELTVDSGLAAILLGTSPLFTVLFAHLSSHDERATWRTLTGIGFGFAGMVVLVGPGILFGQGSGIFGQFLVVLASIGYAFSNVVAGRLQGVQAPVAAAGTMISAAVIMIPVSLAVDQPWTLAPSAEAVGSLLILGCLCTAMGQIVFYRLANHSGATFTSTVGYLTPLVGVVTGILLLDEKPDIFAYAALVLILAGLLFVRGRRRPEPTADPRFPGTLP